MNWNALESEAQLKQIIQESKTQRVLIYKHSTRCSISSMALARLERAWNEQDMRKIKPYYLDLIAFRNLSSEIAQRYQVEHESPQVLVIENNACIYTESHNGIRYDELKAYA
jgi:bacillithiol system protein YtxJ